MRHRFHAICPYFAMFPEIFVRKQILAWSNPGDIILDPFCGRGTTVFEGILNDRIGIGCDTNPVAACISKAKADPPSLAIVLDRIETLEHQWVDFTPSGAEWSNEFFTACFHKHTLSQVLFLRESLDWRTDQADSFVAALALGCLHGESHRTPACFSNRMPRTISTKPAYSIKWWKEQGYVAPDRDVFSILKDAARYRYESPLPKQKGIVAECDARRASRLLSRFKEAVKLVVTSPPYLDITDYHEDQWLRVWFLGGPMMPRGRRNPDDRHGRAQAYWKFLSEAWAGITPLLSDACQMIIRIGGTRLSRADLQAGLQATLDQSGRNFKFETATCTEIRNSQRRTFGICRAKSAVEYDFRFSTA